MTRDTDARLRSDARARGSRMTRRPTTITNVLAGIAIGGLIAWAISGVI